MSESKRGSFGRSPNVFQRPVCNYRPNSRRAEAPQSFSKLSIAPMRMSAFHRLQTATFYLKRFGPAAKAIPPVV